MKSHHIDFVPSRFFFEVLTKEQRENSELRISAIERAACVSYFRIFKEFTLFSDSSHVLQNAARDCSPANYSLTIRTASESLDVSCADLDAWAQIVAPWSRDEWFYVLYIDLIRELGVIEWGNDGWEDGANEVTP